MAEEIVIRSELLGFGEFIQEVNKSILAAIDRDEQTLHEQLISLMNDIKENYVPVDTGNLRDSGYVSDPIQTPNGMVIALGFTEEYALIQHERLDYNHPHGQAKYLEVPLEQFYERTK